MESFTILQGLLIRFAFILLYTLLLFFFPPLNMETNYSDKTTHIRCDSHSPSENNTALPSDRETAQLSAGNNSRPGDHSHGCLDIELN